MTRDELARIALRYDTLMSRAFLRALGLDPPSRGREGRVIANADRYDGLAECMGQRHGVIM